MIGSRLYLAASLRTVPHPTRLQRRAGAVVVLAATLVMPAIAPPAGRAAPTCDVVSSSGALTTYLCGPGPSLVIRDATTATPYPSSLTVDGIEGVISDVKVELAGLTHARPDDIDMKLGGPQGTSSILLSDVGGTYGVSGLSLTIDSAGPPAPDTGRLMPGTYRPTDSASWGDENDPFLSPAPAGALADLTTFRGISPNGTWKLFVVDDEATYAGSLASWSLRITVTSPTAPNPQPAFDLVHSTTAPPALLMIADGDRYLLRDPAAARLYSQDEGVPGEPNRLMRYDDLDPLSGEPRSIATGNADADPGQEILVVNQDGSAALLEDAAVHVTDPSAPSIEVAGGYRLLHAWDASTGALDGALVDLTPTRHAVALVTPSATGWDLRLFDVSGNPLGRWALGEYANGNDFRYLDIAPVVGDPHSLVIAETWTTPEVGGEVHQELAVAYATIWTSDSAMGGCFLALGMPDLPSSPCLQIGLATIETVSGLRSATVEAIATTPYSTQYLGYIGGGVAVAVGYTTDLDTNVGVLAGKLYLVGGDTTGWIGVPSPEHWLGVPVLNPDAAATCPQVRRPDRPSVALTIGDVSGGDGTVTIGCATTTAVGSTEELGLRTWQFLLSAGPGTLECTGIVCLPQPVLPDVHGGLASIKGTIRDATPTFMFRLADGTGAPVSPPTGLWQIGFLTEEVDDPGTVIRTARIAGLKQDLGNQSFFSERRVPVTTTGVVTPPQSLVVTGEAFALAPVSLVDHEVSLVRATDAMGNVLPLRSVDLPPIPQILLAAPPQVRGLGQDPGNDPSYSTGTLTGTGTGDSHEVTVDITIGANPKIEFMLGAEFETTVSTGLGWQKETNSTVEIEDVYLGSADQDAVVVSRTTMWTVPYRVISSSDGFGVGTIVQLSAPRTTVLAVETLSRLRAEAPELFDGTLASTADWERALPHTAGPSFPEASGDPARYLSPGAEVATYCDAGGRVLESGRHQVVEGNMLAEGARVSTSSEATYSETVTTGISYQVIGTLLGMETGVEVGYAYGHMWSTTIGTKSSFEGYVGGIAATVDGFAEGYGWGLFVCKKQVGSFTTWVANYSVGSPSYGGRGGYEALTPVETIAPAAYETVPALPTYEWTGGGSVNSYLLELQAIGTTGGFTKEIAVGPSAVDVDAAAVQSWTPPDEAEYRLVPGTSYRWRVHSRGYLGNEEVSPWSLLTTGKAGQSISFEGPGAQTYGVAPLDLSATASSGLPVTFAATGACTVSGTVLTVTGAGTCSVTASQPGTATIGAAADVTRSFAVGRAALTVTAAAKSRTYGAAEPAFTVGYSGFVNGDGPAQLGGAPACTTTATVTSAPGAGEGPGGTYAITCSGLSSPNYDLTYVAGQLTVERAALTVTARDVARSLGETNGGSDPAFTVEYAGFVNGQTPAVLGGSLLVTTLPATVSATVPGTYALHPSGLTSPNYDITYVDGRLTVSYRICPLYSPTKPFTGSNVPLKLTLCNAAGQNLSSRSIALTALRVEQAGTPVVTLNGASFTFAKQLVAGGGYQYNVSTKGLTTGRAITFELVFRVATDPAGVTHRAPFILK